MTGADRTQEGGSTPRPDVEHGDAPAGRVALLLGALLGVTTLVCLAVAGSLLLFDRWAGRQAPPPPADLSSPEPRLQVHEPAQRMRLEQAAAGSDAAIRRAMARLAASGWPE